MGVAVMEVKMTPQLKELLKLANQANRNGGIDKKTLKKHPYANDVVEKSRRKAEELLLKLG